MEGDRLVQLLKEAGISTNDPRFKAAVLDIVRAEISNLDRELPNAQAERVKLCVRPAGESVLAEDHRLRSLGSLDTKIRTIRYRGQQLTVIKLDLEFEEVEGAAVPA